MTYHHIFDKVSNIAFYNEVRYDPASSKNEPQGVGVFFVCKFKKKKSVLFFQTRL